ncbi:hypothetical protein ACB092_02G045900 [Castanea dentata]
MCQNYFNTSNSPRTTTTTTNTNTNSITTTNASSSTTTTTVTTVSFSLMNKLLKVHHRSSASSFRSATTTEVSSEDVVATAAAAASDRVKLQGFSFEFESEVNQCFGCRRKVGLTGFRCRCGELFCAEHRYTDRHECSYDYKAAGREAIARVNPK